MNGSIFVLSGEELTLPQAEINSLIGTYAPSEKIEPLASRVLFSSLSDPGVVEKISRRAAYCRFGGILHQSSDSLEDLTEGLSPGSIEKGRTFVASSETLDRSMVGELGGSIKQKTEGKVSLEEPDYIFQVEKTDRGFVLGVSKGGFKEFSWRTRRPRARKFFLPSAIYPKLACALVNLSRVREGDIFLDPFCGTGSLLIESSRMGIRTVGSDLTRWIARGALLNMKGFLMDFEGILRCDSTSRNLPFSSMDGISTDVPYGRASSTRGKATETIIEEFTHAAGEILAHRDTAKYCVIMHPSHINFDFDQSAFELAERHFIYVHRNLTRAISILRSTAAKR
jgi:tRNA (guanine10-N2)-dimethyltransferase